MPEYKVLLGILATILAFIGYFPYVRNTIRGTTKPHAFSWLVWGVLEGIGFVAQVVEGAGPGAWVLGFSAVVTFGIFILALKKGSREFATADWIALAGALIAIVLWRITDNPTLAVIFVVLADAIGFIPTFRKTFHRPHEETLTEYTLAFCKHILSIFALRTYSVATWLYPASLVITNASLVVLALVRRRALKRSVS